MANDCAVVMTNCSHKQVQWWLAHNYLLGKGGYVFGSVGLSVCGQHYSKNYQRIGMKFYGGVPGSTMKKWLNVGGNLGILRRVNERKKTTIIVVAYPDCGAGNDPEHLGLAFYHQGPTLLHWEIWE